MDRDKDKNKSPKSSPATRSGTPTASLRGICSRTELDALIGNQAGPVTNTLSARKWLENKGWLLTDEIFDRTKLVNMLLTMTMLPKVPPEVTQAIRAVAFVLDEDITDNISSTLAATIADKVKTELTAITNDLKTSKTFLEASSVQQASSILDLNTAISKATDISNNLSATTNKLTSLSPPTTTILPPNPWHSAATRPHQQSLPNPTYDPTATTNHTKLKQRILQSARSVYIQSDPNGTNGNGSTPTLTDQELQKLRNDLNSRLEELDAKTTPIFPPEENPLGTADTIDRPKTVIKGIHMRISGDFILELDSPNSVSRFIEYTNEHIFLLSVLSPGATVKPRTFSLICKFVPCASDFEPSNDECIRKIESDHNLKTGSILAASWLKRPDRRAPTQQVATLKVNCADPQTANALLSGQIAIEEQLITVLKDIREPIRCNGCQEYGHIRINCKNKAACAHCASNDHESTNCPPNQPARCHSCGPNSRHASYSRDCPEFINRSATLNARYPENMMPYFPTEEKWTWASSPPKLSNVTDKPHTRPPRNRPPPPKRQQANLDQFLKPGTNHKTPNTNTGTSVTTQPPQQSDPSTSTITNDQ
jgi:hypothetical protein